jgi:predicted phosphodiesterase
VSGAPDRFAVIADVHGNADALAAVLTDIDAQGIGLTVNLGDCLSGALWPARTAEMLMARQMLTLCGNHDRSLIDRPRAQMGDWDKWADAEIGPNVRSWIAALPPTLDLGEVFACHGTPNSDTTYWLHEIRDGEMRTTSPAQVAAQIGMRQHRLFLCAHTHLAAAVTLPDGRLVVNPGSVGNPAYDNIHPEPHRAESGTPHARYAVLERLSAGWSVAFRLVPYDPTAAIAQARSRGAEDWVNPLSTGYA